ncbi:hypothetical protein PGT21_015040 [Puccinia graminis f. sp. tritici]|uniref:Carbamoyl-phosphate synthetase large subunit oligomerisation domain-containing protein n=1 Tax=Puccinia graminis f. sp. tritici TaxID=56615 RepID=A0A5B0N5T3_PUCGR|nr:hypothetical protein PGT21_015040 [Puccinia graminis f. sp. tritici]
MIGSYGVPKREDILLPTQFESSQIHVAALVVGSYSGDGEDFSHHLAESPLGQWLQEHGIPAICGVDTRALTKKIRERGVMLAKLLSKSTSPPTSSSNSSVQKAPLSRLSGFGPPRESSRADYIDIPLHDFNTENLVQLVSRTEPTLYQPQHLPAHAQPAQVFLNQVIGRSDGHRPQDELKQELTQPTDHRIFAIANAFNAGWMLDEVWEMTRIDKWFLSKLKHLVTIENIVRKYHASNLPVNLLRYTKQLGFSDNQLSRFLNSNELAIPRLRLVSKISSK